MYEEDPNQSGEDTSKLNDGGESEDADIQALFGGEENHDEESSEEKVTRLENEMATIKKGVAKFFSEKGRKEKATNTVQVAQSTTNHSSDDVTELFLESKPQAEFVKDDLKTIADAKYGGSIIKAWKGETWLHAKAQALSEETANKGKINAPDSRTQSTVTMDVVARMSDDEQAQSIKKMSDKDYQKWQEFQRNHSNKSGVLSL